jgi:hypothetical protein
VMLFQVAIQGLLADTCDEIGVGLHVVFRIG